MKTVVAKTVTGNGLWWPWASRKSFDIECGACSHAYRDKVFIRDNATSLCPACGALNRWNLKQWAIDYDAAAERDARRLAKDGAGK